MKISEFDREKKQIDTLVNQKDSLVSEMERVQNVLENVDDIVSDLDKQFSEKTGILNKTDMSFLFVAIMLQSLRWILSPEMKIPKIEKLKDEDLRVAKADRLKSDEKQHKGGIYDKRSSGSEYEEKQINIYLSEHEEKYEASRKEYHGENGRDTQYRTWIEIMLRAVPYDAMLAQDKQKVPNISGLNKYNEKEKRYSNISGRNHHVATLGHDPVLGWIFGTMNIMSSSITFCDLKTYDVVQTNPTLNKWGQVINYAKQYSTGDLLEYCVNSGMEDGKRIPAAVTRQAIHFASDKYCVQGLPIPLLSRIDPKKAQELIEKGWNSREFSYLTQHDLGVIGVNAVISILINEILKAIYLYCLELDEKDEKIKEVRIRKVLTVANLIVSTSNVVFTSVTGRWEKLDIGGIGVSLIQLFTTKKFIDEVKQEFIASGIEQAIMGDDDWLQYALKENPNMSKREEFINQGRHQIADPMAKKMGELKEGTEVVLTSAINAVDRQNNLLKQLVTEGKDKSLEIKRLVSFADFTEDHDVDIAHKILDRYCTYGIEKMNDEGRELRKGLNESKKFIDYHNATDRSYESLFGELEEKEKTSKLLFEIITLYNCFAGGNYNEEEYLQLLDEMVLSKKERTSIREFIESCYLEYSINKWVEILLAGYNLVEKDFTDKHEDILKVPDELQGGIGSNNREDEFDEIALTKMQAIMEKHGICKKDEDYKRLAEVSFGIAPDAYLGVHRTGIFFTVTGLYVKVIDGADKEKWIYKPYKEICVEKITIRPEGKNKETLVVPDVNGESFRFSASKEVCEEFTVLLGELRDIKTAEYDEYNPIWLEETYVYGEILVDFLKLGDHNTFAALMKCSVFIGDGEDDKDNLFKQICEYGLSAHKIAAESLKEKVLELKNTFAPHMTGLYMAILFKDLVEILQLASGEPCAMTFAEKSFLEWLAVEAGIEEIDKFKEVVMLPYCMISEVENVYSSYSQKIADMEQYAYEKQLYIPYNILDNEKIGFWGLLHTTSKKYWSFIIPSKKQQEELNDLVNECKWISLLDYIASMSCFVDRLADFEDEIITKQQIIDFIQNCKLVLDVSELIYTYMDDENWLETCVKYFENDRRYVGEEMVKYVEGKDN